MPIHLIFDLLAASLAFAAAAAAYRWRIKDSAGFATIDTGYALALVAGAALGGYGLGTLNLVLSSQPSVGRSILGAIAGAILAIELYKAYRGIRTSTGLIFVASFPVSIIVGRIGCYLSGLPDMTYGTPTSAPWGHDFGDGIARHPVQLYESFLMFLFVVFAVFAAKRRDPFFMANGFYLMIGYYAAQRFVLEFFKPYATILGPLNLFHLVCLGLLAYAFTMMWRGWDVRT